MKRSFQRPHSEFHGIRSSERHLATLGDLRLIAELPVLATLSRLLPERRWNSACRRIASLAGDNQEIAARIRWYFSKSSEAPADPVAVARDLAAARKEHFMQVLGATRHPPAARLEGKAVLEEALSAAKGSVLWVAHFVFAPLATKIALADAGHRVWHMSRPEHGFSKTRFGIAILNPIRWQAEERSLAGRIIIDRRNPAASTLRAARILANNGLVSVTAGDWEGARVLEMPFGTGRLGLSNGAPGLAHLTGAALLPVFAVREAPGEAIDVIIQNPIEPDRTGSKVEWIEASAVEFMERHKPFIERFPGQWRGWGRLRIGPPAGEESGPTQDG